MPRITITEPDKVPQPYRFDLATNFVRIGRRSENEIIIQCASASGSHAEMARVPGGFELRDLASTNGIIRNGERIQAWHLSDGDQLLLGDVVFDFQLNEEELAVLAGEITPDHEPDIATSEPATENADRQESTSVSTSTRISGWWLVLAFLILGPLAIYQGFSMRRANEDAKETKREITAEQSGITTPTPVETISEEEANVIFNDIVFPEFVESDAGDE